MLCSVCVCVGGWVCVCVGVRGSVAGFRQLARIDVHGCQRQEMPKPVNDGF